LSEAAGFRLKRLRGLRASLVPHDWAWAADNADAIAENWNRRRAARPSLFDGRVLLASAWRVADGICEVAFFETGFARFLAHRDAGFPDRSVANAFAAIVPCGADGAAILGRMGGHTANAGQVYFPCGTPDPSDIRGEAEVDLAGSAAREFREETGIDLPADAPEAWLLLEGGGQLAFLRPTRFPEDAATLAARMEAHRRAEVSPELDGFVIARRGVDVEGERMPGFIKAYFRLAHPAGAPD
jgi:8-oxo-dGTP pyrophosphatase MutT (NUDIX family)